MPIVDLRHYPYYLPLLAQWHFAEWAYLHPGCSIGMLEQDMQKYLQPDFLPSMFIMLDQQQLLGSSSIVANDLATRPQLSPWLANVYVHSSYRGQGMGRRLVQFAMQQAKAAGVKRLYLFTADQQAFYHSMGWQSFDHEIMEGTEQTIMCLDFD